MNLKPKYMEYELKFKTENLDISPLAGVNTNLNSNGKVKGKGTNPSDYLTADVFFNGNGSTVKGNKIDSLIFNAQADNKNIAYNLHLKNDTTRAYLNGSFNFETKGHPKYDLKGTVNDFNVAEISNDTSLITSLNFNIDAEGENFDPEKMNLYLSTKLFDSYVNDIYIDSTRAIVDLRSDDHGERIINIISDLADITISGNYTVDQAIDLMRRKQIYSRLLLKIKLMKFYLQNLRCKEDIK